MGPPGRNRLGLFLASAAVAAVCPQGGCARRPLSGGRTGSSFTRVPGAAELEGGRLEPVDLEGEGTAHEDRQVGFYKEGGAPPQSVTAEEGQPGGPPQDVCDHVIKRARALDFACDVDEFFDASWVVASVIECQLMKVSTLLDLTAAEFTKADNASMRDQEARNGGMDGGGHPASIRTSSMDFDKMEECECPKCFGHRYQLLHSGRGILIFPQLLSTGDAYAYPGPDVHPLTPDQDSVTNDPVEINRGLQFATMLEQAEGFFDSELFAQNLGSHDHYRARYRGNDPAIIVELTTARSAKKQMCEGRPNRNQIDSSNYQTFFACQRKAPEACKDIRTMNVRPFWSPTHRSGKMMRSVASKVVFDARWKAMGTIAFDVDMTAMGVLLGELKLAAQAYAMIIDRRGGIVSMTQSARDWVFHKDMTEFEVLGEERDKRCSPGDPCWWEPPQVLTLNNAKEDAKKYSGADFEEVRKKMFDWNIESGIPPADTCYQKMHEFRVTYPKEPEDQQKHIVSYCAFSAVLGWGLIVGSPEKDLTSNKWVTLNSTLQGSVQHDVAALSESDAGRIMKDQQVVKTFTIRSSVDKDVPFKVEQTNLKFAQVTPLTGYLRPNRTLTLYVKYCGQDVVGDCAGEYLTEGHHRGAFHITADLTKRKGTCFRGALTGEVHLVVKRRYGFMWWLGGVGIALVSVGFILLTLRLCYSGVKRHWKTEAQQTEQIQEALDTINSLAHPMVLIPMTVLKKQGRLVSHEEAQENHQIIWLYSVSEVSKFRETHQIIFVSHQWTSFTSPDHSGKQYNAMRMALDGICARFEWQESCVFVWVDYISIPQRHRGLQRLAINALTVYAACVGAFVIVAPEVEHKELGHMCCKASYQDRSWCRAEQLSHLLAVGSANMFLAEEGCLSHLDEDWLKQSLEVFHGELTCCQRKHEGMKKCDKEYLVTPMLGLWSKVLKDSRERESREGGDAPDDPYRADPLFRALIDHLKEHLTEIFPPTFEFETHHGVKERVLFGSLLEKLEERLDQEAKGIYSYESYSEATQDPVKATLTSVKNYLGVGGRASTNDQQRGTALCDCFSGRS